MANFEIAMFALESVQYALIREGCFFFFSSHLFASRRVWLELFYWAAFRHVPSIYRRLRMCREATAPQGRAGTRLAVSGRVASANTSLVRGWLPSVTMLAKHRVGSHSCMDCYQMCVRVCVCVSLQVMGCQCVKASLNLKATFCEHSYICVTKAPRLQELGVTL